MLEIYFDGVLIDPINYMSLTQKWVMFDKEFKLGTAMSREFNLTVPQSIFNENTQEVLIKYNSNDYAHLIIDDFKYNQNAGIPSVDITLCDRMILANFNYDASKIVPTTTLGILQDICNKIGVELGNTEFPNSDEPVDFYDNSIQARDYISYISECAGGFARIENDGKLWIRHFNNLENTKDIIPDLCEQIIVGQKHEIQRVVFDNGLVVFKTDYDEDEKETLYLNSNNMYINTQEQFDNIVEKIIGFIYYNLDTGKTLILPTSMTGDVLKLTYDNFDYYTIQQTSNLNYMGVWQGSYQLNLNSNKQAETKIDGYKEKIKAIKINQNRMDNILTIAVQDIDFQKNTTNVDLFNKIEANTTLISQTANEINSSVKQIAGELQGDIDTVNQDLINATAQLQNKIIENTTLIQQLATSIISTIKTTGGNNLLRNSVGFAGLDFWETTGSVTSSQDSEVENTTVSGSKFTIVGAGSIKQQFINQVGMTYGVSFKIKHIKAGSGSSIKVRIHKTTTDIVEILVGENQTKEFLEFETFNEFTYVATSLNPIIEVVCSGSDTLEISDLIISIGENQSWSGYFDEVYGKEHRLDKYGLQLTDLSSGDYSKQTSRSLTFVDNGNVVSEISQDKVKSDNGEFENSYKIRRLHTVALNDDNVIEYI